MNWSDRILNRLAYYFMRSERGNYHFISNMRTYAHMTESITTNKLLIIGPSYANRSICLECLDDFRWVSHKNRQTTHTTICHTLEIVPIIIESLVQAIGQRKAIAPPLMAAPLIVRTENRLCMRCANDTTLFKYCSSIWLIVVDEQFVAVLRRLYQALLHDLMQIYSSLDYC